MSGSAGAPTRRVALKVAGQQFDAWTEVEIVRDLAEIAGSFLLEYHDAARTRATLPASAGPLPIPAALKPGQAVALAIDGEPVLTGHIDEVKLTLSGTELRASVAGRDRAGDLVDCAAAPSGPAEYRGLTVTEIARRICAPFGIAVRADVDVGPPLPRFSIDVAETAMSAIEKAARQRALLVVSDGTGGLVLTRSGARRGPAPVVLPGNVLEATALLSWKERYSETIVKGQTERAAGGRGPAPAFTAAASPLTPEMPAPVRRPGAGERAGVVMTGRARDAGVDRYRPRVVSAKTQSGGVSVQQQAEWLMRTARAEGERLTHTVADWRAGDEGRLWRPNELVLVDDPYAGVYGDMLVAAVRYTYGRDGHRTELSLVGPEAFEILPEDADARRGRERTRPPGGGGSSVASPLTAEPPPAAGGR